MSTKPLTWRAIRRATRRIHARFASRAQTLSQCVIHLSHAASQLESAIGGSADCSGSGAREPWGGIQRGRHGLLIPCSAFELELAPKRPYWQRISIRCAAALFGDGTSDFTPL